jgi:hypothetical protein
LRDNQIKKEASRLDTREASSSKKPNPSITMSNIQIETDLKEILQELKNGQKEILHKVEEIDKKVIEIDKRLVKVETKLESELPTLQKGIDEMKGSQKAQIWTLIGILFTAVGGFIVAIGRSVFSNP